MRPSATRPLAWRSLVRLDTRALPLHPSADFPSIPQAIRTATHAIPGDEPRGISQESRGTAKVPRWPGCPLQVLHGAPRRFPSSETFACGGPTSILRCLHDGPTPGPRRTKGFCGPPAGYGRPAGWARKLLEGRSGRRPVRIAPGHRDPLWFAADIFTRNATGESVTKDVIDRSKAWHTVLARREKP